MPVSVCWRHEDGFSEWKLDYRYNSLAMSCPATLKNVAVMVRLPTETDVSGLQTHPIDGKWCVVVVLLCCAMCVFDMCGLPHCDCKCLCQSAIIGVVCCNWQAELFGSIL